MTMRGKTLSPNAVATYLENLKKSPFFAEPVFKVLGQDGETRGPTARGDDADLHPIRRSGFRPCPRARSRPDPRRRKKGKGA